MNRYMSAVVSLVSLSALAYGVAGANPVAYFGTPEEHAALASGRAWVIVGAIALVASAALVARLGHRVLAALVAAPGVVCASLVLAAPSALYALLAFLVLAPAALGAVIAVTALRRA